MRDILPETTAEGKKECTADNAVLIIAGDAAAVTTANLISTSLNPDEPLARR
jgi:hypothetical protein